MTPEELDDVRGRDEWHKARGYADASVAVLDRASLLAALDEARRERDEARSDGVRAAQRETHALLVEAWDRCLAEGRSYELRHAVDALDEACDRVTREPDRVHALLLDMKRDRDEARQELCALLDGHLSPSDAVRAAAITRATAARRGWGM